MKRDMDLVRIIPNTMEKHAEKPGRIHQLHGSRVSLINHKGEICFGVRSGLSSLQSNPRCPVDYLPPFR